MTDQEQLIKTLQDELVLQGRQRRHDIVQSLIRTGHYHIEQIPAKAAILCDWIEGEVSKPEKKLGRPAKKPSVPKKKRKYTKKSAFWSKK